MDGKCQWCGADSATNSHSSALYYCGSFVKRNGLGEQSDSCKLACVEKRIAELELTNKHLHDANAELRGKVSELEQANQALASSNQLFYERSDTAYRRWELAEDENTELLNKVAELKKQNREQLDMIHAVCLDKLSQQDVYERRIADLERQLEESERVYAAAERHVTRLIREQRQVRHVPINGDEWFTVLVMEE